MTLQVQHVPLIMHALSMAQKSIINSKLTTGLFGRIHSFNKHLLCLIFIGYSTFWGYRVDKTDENHIWSSGSIYFWFIPAQYLWKKKLIQEKLILRYSSRSSWLNIAHLHCWLRTVQVSFSGIVLGDSLLQNETTKM